MNDVVLGLWSEVCFSNMVVGTFCILNNYTMLLLNDICFQFQHYATTFPIVSVDDMVHAFFLALDSLGIQKVTQHCDVKIKWALYLFLVLFVANLPATSLIELSGEHSLEN